jgi:hypothetical protein
MHDVIGMLEGHWPTHFVSITYSSYLFQSHSFQPHGIIPSFPMQLGGRPCASRLKWSMHLSDYNLLLGRSWTYAMHAVVATVFWVLLFPHEGRIVSIDQLSFSHPDPSSRASTVPMIDNPQPDIINLGVGLCPPLMGTFNYPPPTGDVKYISTVPDQPRAEIFQVSSFHTTYFNDLWTLPSPSAMMEGTRHHGMAMPLFCNRSCVLYSPASFRRPRSDSRTGVRSGSRAYLGSRFPHRY